MPRKRKTPATSKRKKPAKRKRRKPATGRPTLISRALTRDASNLIEAGHPPEVALGALGVSRTTYYRWMREGAVQARGLKKSFFKAISEARSKQEARLATLISVGAEKDWRAAAFMLERRFPSRWGRRQFIEFGNIDPKDLTDEQLEAIARGEPAEKVLDDRHLGSAI